MARWNQRRVIFKNFNQGQSNPERDWEIAYWVDELRRNGSSYEDATADVADRAKLSPEHVKKICGKVKLGFDPPQRARRKSPRKR
jgi:hypothetical protein